jgi:hypothetical protein
MYDGRCWMQGDPLIPIVFVHRTSNIVHKATFAGMPASINRDGSPQGTIFLL